MWYKALLNKYGESNNVVDSGGRESLVWWRDINKADITRLSHFKEYLVSEVCKRVVSFDQSTSSHPCGRVWNKVIPSKVVGMVWRLLQNRLPTVDNLIRRGKLVTV